MADIELSITIDPESTSDELVLSVGEVTFGIKSKEKIKKKRKDIQDHQRIPQHTRILRAVCALMNSRGGKVKAHIENQDYDFTKHGIWEDLETSLKGIIPLVHNYLDFYLKGRDIYISVKSCSFDTSGVQPATIATNLYKRNGASSVSMDLRTALQFFKEKDHPGERSPSQASLLDEQLEEKVKDEIHVQKKAAAFFDQTTLTEMAEFDFGESKNVEYKSFETDKLIQRVKEALRRTVSAFANTDGGYLFIGLDEKKNQIIGFKAEESEREELKEEIEKCIRQLPVTHFCEEKQQIKYKCRFIQVLRAGTVCSYVCALRVERFCCAVFAKKPDSWHVEDSYVKRFSTEEWVKVLMASRPGSGRETGK
ncbi:schlafen family member 12-like [Sigmodon hispidus]